MQRFLFELAAFSLGGVVERRSSLVSDGWLRDELERDLNPDRLVTLPEDYYPMVSRTSGPDRTPSVQCSEPTGG